MKKIFTCIALFVFLNGINGQSLYFPPTTSTTWDTLAPSALGWCQPDIDSLYSFLQVKNTAAFIILKNGNIVLEKYFGTFTADSLHIWDSAGKSLAAFLAGIARQNNLINVDSPVTHYLGPGWTSETTIQEDSITLLNLLTMTSGTSPNPSGSCTNVDTNAACLQYLAPAGSQWAYHTGAYRKIEDVLSITSGEGYNTLSENYLGIATGMTGMWVAQEFYSTPRSAARFGLLALNKGIWAGDTLLKDTGYFQAMTNTSQVFNLSYGYLWWLNGKASFMSPGPQTVYAGPLIPNAPADMFCALGKNDQKIYVVPGDSMVVVRMGNAADSVADALTAFDNELWGYIDRLSCTPSSIYDLGGGEALNIYPNPANGIINILYSINNQFKGIRINNVLGSAVAEYPYSPQIDISQLTAGIYMLRIIDFDGNFVATGKIVKK